nr:hypothetical protein GCM10020092_089760 [Actinoplanes digitatis]
MRLGDVLVELHGLEALEPLRLVPGDERRPDRDRLTGLGEDLPRQDVDVDPHREAVGQDLRYDKGRVDEGEQHHLAALVQDVDELAGLGAEGRVAAAGEQVEVRDDDDVALAAVPHRDLELGEDLLPAPGPAMRPARRTASRRPTRRGSP